MGYKGNNLNVTLPPEILNRIEEVSKAKDMSKSRICFETARKRYLNYRRRIEQLADQIKNLCLLSNEKMRE